MATHSSILSWRIPGTEEPGGLPTMGSHRVKHNWSDLATPAAVTRKRDLSNEVPILVEWVGILKKKMWIHNWGLPQWLRWQRICLQCRRPGFGPWVGKIPWRRAWQPFLPWRMPVFLPGESPRTDAWWATVHGVTKSRMQLRDWAQKHIMLPFENQGSNLDVHQQKNG